MNSIPTVPALLFKAATTALNSIGVSPDRIVEKLRIPRWHHREPQTPVPGDHFYRLVGQSAVIMGTDRIGYDVAKYTPVSALDDFGAEIARSLTVYQAIETFNTLYGRMSSIDRFWTVDDGEGLWWLRERVQAADRTARQQVQTGALHYMIQTVRLGAGPEWAPCKIRLEGASQSAIDEVEDFGRAVIHERQGASGCWIPRSILARRIPATRSSSSPPGDSKLFAQSPPSDFPESLRRIVRAYVPFGYPRIEEIADAAGMSTRALQRRLKKNGLTFKRIVGEAQFQAAADLLCDPQMRFVEIAHGLGYGDQANFVRAFRRWAGMTPGEYRRQLHLD